MGGLAIIVRSFARIHETNLKKQGMLALTFVNPEDYDKILPDDHVDIVGLTEFAPGKNMTLVVKHKDGKKDVCCSCHSDAAFMLKSLSIGNCFGSFVQSGPN
jgi:aconitate hydratase